MKPLKECKVLVTPTSYASQDESLRTNLEEKVREVVYNTTGKPLSSAQLQDLLGDVDGMIAGLDEIDAAALAVASDLKVVARYGVGYNNVDLDAAKKLQVTVTNTPGANAKSVAELSIAFMLILLRPVLLAVNETKAGGWPRFKGFSLEGKTVGLVGCGAIGKETVRRLTGFDCEILANDVVQDDAFSKEYQVSYVALDELLARADIVSLHLPGQTFCKYAIHNASRFNPVLSESDLDNFITNKRSLAMENTRLRPIHFMSQGWFKPVFLEKSSQRIDETF